MKSTAWLLLALMLLPGAGVSAEPRQIGPAWVYTTDSNFNDARDDLVTAIEGRGLVISYVSHAATMLERTAAAVGNPDPVYGNAEILLFCKADLSHALVAANPHNIVLCPYAISVYTLAGRPDTAYYAIREPYAGEKAYQPVFQLLLEIVAEAMGD